MSPRTFEAVRIDPKVARDEAPTSFTTPHLTNGAELGHEPRCSNPHPTNASCACASAFDCAGDAKGAPWGTPSECVNVKPVE